MKLPHELEPEVSGGADHDHEWKFAVAFPHQRKHILTDQMVTMVSVLQTCGCGAQHHSWMIPPPEPEADKQRAMTGQDAVDPRIIS